MTIAHVTATETVLVPAEITALQLVDVVEVAPMRFRNTHNQTNHSHALFGGQVMAQALAAAFRTVAHWPAHSLHGYFVRGGSIDLPVDYAVEAIRDGRRFATRAVVASQAGRTIFQMHCSFHDPEPGFEHAFETPANVPDPEGLVSLRAFIAANVDRLAPAAVRNYSAPFPFELRPVDPEANLLRGLDAPHRDFWTRMPSAAGIDDSRLQQCLLTSLSDYWLAGVAAGPHVLATTSNDFLITSLDHAIWFHHPVRVDEWLFYRTDSPAAQQGRGLARGSLFDRQGRLVASTAQEALMRLL